MKTTYLRKTLVAFGLGLLANACTNESTGNSSATSTGGSSASSATTSSGGSVGKGGSTASGGTVSTGGSKASGGTTSSGGAVATGGGTSSGGAPGGTTGTGGSKTSGSTTGSSGLMGSGGATGSGGTPGTDGGVPPTDGNIATGGAKATGGASGSGGTSGTGGATHTGKWQIMPLGDSITGYCYPQLLSKELIDSGHTNFTFMGKVTNNQSCGSGAPNVQTEGHGGYLVTYLTTDSPAASGKGTLTELKTWAAEKPEVVLMEIGTNDVWSNIAPATITSTFSFVVDQFRAQNPSVIFFVAQITPLNPSGCTNPSCESRVEGLNAQIPAWATGKNTAASPIYVVDVWSALDPATYVPNSTWTKDGCHPELPASQLMADKWYAALVAHGIP